MDLETSLPATFFQIFVSSYYIVSCTVFHFLLLEGNAWDPMVSCFEIDIHYFNILP